MRGKKAKSKKKRGIVNAGRVEAKVITIDKNNYRELRNILTNMRMANKLSPLIFPNNFSQRRFCTIYSEVVGTPKLHKFPIIIFTVEF